MASRPLTLHASALTNEEYTLYTTSLCDLAGEDEGARRSYHEDSYYAALKISAREARAWIRGRYTDLAPSSVDAVLKLFCPNMTVTDVLTGGQFFAALRLVTHVRHGRALDGNLVFVQGKHLYQCSLCLQDAKAPMIVLIPPILVPCDLEVILHHSKSACTMCGALIFCWCSFERHDRVYR